MDNLTILFLQQSAAFLVIFFGLKWWVFPKLANLSIQDALIPFVFLNGIRYVGLTFMVDYQVYEEFPQDVAFVIGIWDYTTCLLALLTTYALRIKWKYAISLVWFFNLYGFIDIMTAFPQLFAVEFYKYDMGASWFTFILLGPITTFSHAYIFYRLIGHLRRKSS